MLLYEKQGGSVNCGSMEEHHHQTAQEGFLEEVRSELGLDGQVGARRVKRASVGEACPKRRKQLCQGLEASHNRGC